MSIAVVVEAVQYTRGREPVLIQFRAASPGGLFASSTLCHTTQAALVARNPGGVGDRWGDDESDAELLAWLTAQDVDAVIVGGT